MSYSIYALKEPASEVVRYIGMTGGDLKKRYQNHVYSLNYNNRKATWIRSLRKRNLFPGLELIEDGLTYEKAIEKEIFFIKMFRAMGAVLTNGTIGGEGFRYGYMSEEMRRKIGDAHRGKKLTQAQIERLKVVNTGRVVPQHVRDAISRGHIGKIVSEATRQKLSITGKKKVFTKAQIDLLRSYSDKKRGTKLSKEHRLKVSVGVKNNPPKTAFKKGQIPWNKGIKGVLTAWNKGVPSKSKGIPRSLEVRTKMSLAKKQGWAKKRKTMVLLIVDSLIHSKKVVK